MPHQVTFLPSQLSLQVNDTETVLESAIRQGFRVPRACDAGTCQLCQGTLISGRVKLKHQSNIIDASETNTHPVFCCLIYPLQDIQLEVHNVLAPGQLPTQQVSAQITHIEQASADVKVVQLRMPAGKKVEFYPGQYLEVVLDAENRAAFSIASAPRADRTLELHIRATTESSSYPLLERRLTVGELLTLSLPAGETTLLKLKDAKRILMIAASTGFSQIKSMLEGLIAAQDQRPVTVYWGARTASDLYQHDDMEAMAKLHTNITYIPVISDQAEWPGRQGFVHKAVLDDVDNFDGS
jgi:CDP-4-dehydro-6-deoxyglucose reductase